MIGKLGYKKSIPEVSIAYLPGVHALPLYVALEQEYFGSLPIRAVRMYSPNQIVDAVAFNRVNFGAINAATGIVAFYHTLGQKNLKIFLLSGSSSKTPVDVLLKRKHDAVQHIGDLKGKRLGILPSLQWRTIAGYMLKQHGLTPEKDTALIELAFPFQIQALASGYIDALLSLEPVGVSARKTGSVDDLLVSPGTTYIADPWYGGCSLVNSRFVKKNRSLAKQVLTGFHNAVEYIQKNPDQMMPILKKREAQYQELVAKLPVPQFVFADSVSQRDLEHLQKLYDIFLEEGVLGSRVMAQPLLYRL